MSGFDNVSLKLEMRFGDYGVVPANTNKSAKNLSNGFLLLVKYEGKQRKTIGRWKAEGEEYSFSSAGSNLFSCVGDDEIEDLWRVLKGVQEFLDTIGHEK